MAAGEAFAEDQRHRIERAIENAERETGLRYAVRVGPVSDEPRLEAERLLANIATGPRDSVVLVLVGPTERLVEVLTTPAARRRISDHAAGLAVLSMVSSFGVGDIVGGIVAGLRQLADAAGPAAAAPPVPEDVTGEPHRSEEAARVAQGNPVRPGGPAADSGVIEGQATERTVHS